MILANCLIKELIYIIQSGFRNSLVVVSSGKGRTIRKVIVGVGNFQAAGIFFRYQIPCMNFF